MSSEYLDEVIAARPELDPDVPFVAVVDALMDATVALAKVVDLVSFDDGDLREEFGLRTEEEQTGFGVKVAVASLTLQAMAQEMADAVSTVFEEWRDRNVTDDEEAAA